MTVFFFVVITHLLCLHIQIGYIGPMLGPALHRKSETFFRKLDRKSEENRETSG